MRHKPRRRKRRRKLAWSQKHAQRVDVYPSMEHLVEKLAPNGPLAEKAAAALMMKHDLESTISPLIAMREIINERIASEATRILKVHHGDDVADVKILVWHLTRLAREALQDKNPEFIPHMSEGLHPESAAVLAGVSLEQMQ